MAMDDLAQLKHRIQLHREHMTVGAEYECTGCADHSMRKIWFAAFKARLKRVLNAVLKGTSYRG